MGGLRAKLVRGDRNRQRLYRRSARRLGLCLPDRILGSRICPRHLSVRSLLHSGRLTGSPPARAAISASGGGMLRRVSAASLRPCAQLPSVGRAPPLRQPARGPRRSRPRHRRGPVQARRAAASYPVRAPLRRPLARPFVRCLARQPAAALSRCARAAAAAREDSSASARAAAATASASSLSW